MPQATDKGNPSHQKYVELSGDDVTGKTDAPNGDVERDVELAQCGVGGLRCRFLQVFAHPNVFVVLVGMLFMTYVASTGVYFAGVVSTIEKRFKLKSSESGLLASMNDISSLCGVLFVSYVGGKYHRPRILGLASIIIAIGSFVMALPQFLYDNPDLQDIFITSSNQSDAMEGGASFFREEFVCNIRANESTICTTEEIETSGSQLGKAWPIVLGQLLCGFGSSAIMPLAVPYIDDAVDSTLVPLYLAATFLPMALGPMIGFSVSSFCLSVFKDFYKINASTLGINPQDPQWQGAWWLGFIIFGFVLCLLSLPFFLFPRNMTKPKSYCCSMGLPNCCNMFMRKGQEESVGEGKSMMEMNTSNKMSGKPTVGVKDFFATLWRLLSNMTYVSSVVGFTFIIISYSGLSLFGTKYIQFQFGVDPAWAGMLLGFAILPGIIIGIILGGVLTARLAGNQQGYATLTILIQITSVISMLILMFLGCPNEDIAGLTSKYQMDHEVDGYNSFGLYSPCNMNCTCKKGVYSPVCGDDGVTYVTACFAGCGTFQMDQMNKTVYNECSCISSTHNSSLDEPISGMAVSGACASGCRSLMPFLIFMGIMVFTATTGYNSAFMLRFRTVSNKDRALAIGLSSFISKILGFIPAPMVFGGAIESQCSYWQESCERTGECLLYDRPGFRFVFFGVTAGSRLLSVLSFCVSLYFVIKNKSVPEVEEDDGTGKQQEKTSQID